ncbi:915_t:CDS:2 [Entrophospora sp. SA101]|nr:14381_t:CDS:2 [Entrophospora sp. SA101]CAJ0832990.1 915_t:CDS:2 [Entrophospora sp. SA101]
MKTTSPSLFIIIWYQALFLFTGLIQSLGSQHLYYQKATTDNGNNTTTNDCEDDDDNYENPQRQSDSLNIIENLSMKPREYINYKYIIAVTLLDIIAGFVITIGSFHLGSGISQVIYSSVVIWCAILSFFLIGRKLTFIQSISIIGVTFGLALSALGIHQSLEVTESSTVVDDNKGIIFFRMFGMVLVVSGTFGYACVYVVSDWILSMDVPDDMIPPSPETICFLVGSFGSGFSILYIIIYTIPNWDILITQEMAKLSQHNSTSTIIFIYILLIIMSFAHNLAYYWLIKHTGNVSTGLLNSLRAVLVFGSSHWFFCQLDSGQCFNLWKGLSTVVVVGFVTSFTLSACRSFHSYSSSSFRISSRVFTPHSSKPKNFFEATKNTPAPYTILDFFDKPFSTTHSPFVFSHGASGIPKHSEKLVSTIPNAPYFSIGCGEDSFFRRYDSLGVADGVGGWKNIKALPHTVVDSSLYSRKLMHYSWTEIEKYHNNFEKDQFYNYDNFQPVNIMQASYEKTLRDCTMEGIIGSSTALIAILCKDELRIANLGDCGIGVIRQNAFIFCNEEQQNSFNYPFQLGSGSLNTPKKDAQTFNIKIQHGDIVVMGSDGLFDNLFEDDILDEIVRFSSKQGGLKVEPQIISDALAWRAKEASEDINHESPFESRATQEGLYYRGGKKDDITVLIAVITDSNNTSNNQ